MILTDTQNAARAWLSSQKAGDVTPHKFQAALNNTILPDLGIQRKQPLWLVILGWQLTVIRKGVYMDGHECPDVFECQMAHYDGPDLVQTPPSLRSGEKEIIPQFHDESSLHALEYKAKDWLGPGQTILQKKTRGRLIHVSDFINPENGCLICQSANGRITRDARKVIYPGANGDDWWDTEQLLTQMKEAISIFEEAHPDSPDALRAWDMNKSDGGKQCKQHDTIIPCSNRHTQFCGQSQKMTLPDGFDVRGMKAKCSPICPFENENCCIAWLMSKQDNFRNQPSMLESLITGAGHHCIFLPKFHCELNPIEMKTFQEAKDTAFKYLDACPVDVIQWFINRSFRFMSAYQLGLTGKAAEWAVRKQKAHRSVSAAAMMHLDAILQPITT
ncbi:hypothetical protein DFJ43DRAFT_1128663 [Lentinula guzmanii]|uniref:Uncharacterized protein n=1 Tax=Lentinula guzmanii TaxID=2804957 RepID=A0AA38JW66_9AGAR|nr:hypothetical protein DFJ43DRAFT_1128663 [Lentinula guzmanii]